MQTVYTRGGDGGSRQRQVADGADVVFTDTGIVKVHTKSNVTTLLMRRIKELYKALEKVEPL